MLITRSPALGILDFDEGIHYGSEDLIEKLSTLNFKAHLFGHIHAQHSTRAIGTTQYSNGAILNGDYSPLFTPNIITIS